MAVGCMVVVVVVAGNGGETKGASLDNTNGWLFYCFNMCTSPWSSGSPSPNDDGDSEDK